MASSQVPLNFRDDVHGTRDAELLLAGFPRGAYLTFRVDDANFVLSYVSSDNGVCNVRIGRSSDGTFFLPDSRVDRVQYATLNDLLRTRAYIDASNAWQRAGSAAARTDTEFKAAATLPKNVRAPTVGAKRPTEEVSVYQAPRVPPTCSHAAQRSLLTATSILAVLGMVFLAYTHQSDGGRALLFHGSVVAHDASAKAESAALVLGTALAQARLDTLTPGKADNALAALPSTCAAAASAWSDAMHRTLEQVQPSVTAAFHSDVAWHVYVWLFIAGAVMSTALMCMNTGSRHYSAHYIRVEALQSIDTKTEAEEEARLKMLARAAAREPPCTAMQARWSLAYILCLAFAALSAAAALQAAHAFGGVPTGIDAALKPFMPVIASRGSERKSAAAARAAALATELDADAMTSSLNSSLSLLADGLQPWRANFRGGALSKLYLPANCSDAMRSVLHHWTGQGARTIVMPLNVAAEVLPSALSWALGVRSLPPQDAVPMNELGVRDPWASNYLLHGWVDVSEPAGIIVPSTASLSHVIMALCSVFVIGHVVLMLVMMAFFTFMATSPTVRRWTQRQHAKAD